MYGYDWTAHTDDGVALRRFNEEGDENWPDPWRTRQFILHPVEPKLPPVTVMVPKGAVLRYRTLNVGWDVSDELTAFIVGWIWPDEEHGMFLTVYPDGLIRVSHEFTAPAMEHPNWGKERQTGT